jgi:protoporphyrinogen IX oxidase
MAYLWFKAFHLIGVVVWFAGLFYIVRLYVYHAEAEEQPEPARTILKDQYQIMERRLFRLITTPGMVLTVTMAIAMLITQPELLKSGWLHVKLAFVAVLLVYHHLCGSWMKKLATGESKFTGQQYRWLNEAPTLLLVVIVMLAIFKNSFPTSAAAWGIFAMIVAMAAIIQLYARKRRLDREKLANSTTEVSSAS